MTHCRAGATSQCRRPLGGVTALSQEGHGRTATERRGSREGAPWRITDVQI
jgi:hypothetical protein